MWNLASLFRPSLRSGEVAQHREADDEARSRQPWQDPDRLERIALYARAGYFNLGYTYETFHLIGEVPPE